METTVLIAASVAFTLAFVTNWITYRLGLQRELTKLRKKALWDEHVAKAEKHWSRRR